MAQVQISQLPTASTLTGFELVPIVQNGVTSQTTTGAISPTSGASLTFLTLTNQPTLTSSRNLVVSTGLVGVDGGPQNPYTISLANTGVTAGTYTFPTIVVNAQGQITSVSSNPTEISTISFGSTGLTPNTPTSGAITVAGTLNIASGGTGATTATTAFNALAPSQTSNSGKYLTTDGTNTSWGSLTAVSSISFGTTGLTPSTATSGAVTVAGTLAVGNGGTGLTTLTAGYIPYGNGTSAFASNSGLTFSGSTLTAPVLIVNSTTSTTPNLTFNASNSGFTSGATIANNYLQTVIQNKSNTAGASTNYVLSNDLGTDSSYYGEFGINSSGFTASGTFADFLSINNGIYFSGHDGDLSVGSGNGFKTYLTWGATGGSAHVINASGAIGLSTNLGTSAATTGTTGYGTSGQVLTSAGSSAAPTWTTPTTGTVTSVAVSGGTTGLTTSGGPITGSGTITLAGTLSASNGGTGVANNAASTITISGNYGSTFVVSGAYSYTFPAATDTLVNLGSTQTLTNKTLTNPTVTNYTETLYSIGNSSTAVTISLANGTYQTVTMTGNCTFTMPSVGAGKSFVLQVNSGTGTFTGTFTSVKWPSNTAPTLTTTASRWDILAFFSDGTNWYGNYVQAFQ